MAYIAFQPALLTHWSHLVISIVKIDIGGNGGRVRRVTTGRSLAVHVTEFIYQQGRQAGRVLCNHLVAVLAKLPATI